MRTQEALGIFLNSRLAQNLKPASIEWYRRKLARFAEVCPELPDDPALVENFLARLGGSDATRANYYQALNAFFAFTSKRYHGDNPMEAMPRPKLDEDSPRPTLDPEELMKLRDAPTSLRDRAILTLFIDTGIRSGELAQLRKQDITAEKIKVQGKGGKQRIVPISEETRRLLLSLMAADGVTDYIFSGHKGHLTSHGLYRIVSGYMRKAGISGPKLGGHRIRHGFARAYLVMGGDTRSLQKILGHKRISTTEKYADLSEQDIIEKHHRFTPLRAVHAAAQQSFLDKVKAVEEAEEILTKKGQTEHGDT